MKVKICLIGLFFIAKIATSQNEIVDDSLWLTSFEEAIIVSENTGKNILMVFSGTDWCRPCIQLNTQILETEEFLSWAKANVVLLVFKFPKSKKNALSCEQQAYNDAMAEKYNPQGYFPKVLIVDKMGIELGCLGFMNVTPSEYIIEIEKIIYNNK